MFVPEAWTSGSANLWLLLHQQHVPLEQLNQMTRLQWHATPRWHHHHLSIYSRLTFLTTSRPPVIHLASTAGIIPHDGKRLRLLTVAGDVTSLLRRHWPPARPADHISGPLNPELYSHVQMVFVESVLSGTSSLRPMMCSCSLSPPSLFLILPFISSGL